MRLTAAIVKEQGVDFSIILVKPGVIHSQNRENIRNSAPANFPRPVILAEKRSNGRIQYHGKKDIIQFLSNVDYRRLPWKEFTI